MTGRAALRRIQCNINYLSRIVMTLLRYYSNEPFCLLYNTGGRFANVLAEFERRYSQTRRCGFCWSYENRC